MSSDHHQLTDWPSLHTCQITDYTFTVTLCESLRATRMASINYFSGFDVRDAYRIDKDRWWALTRAWSRLAEFLGRTGDAIWNGERQWWFDGCCCWGVVEEGLVQRLGWMIARALNDWVQLFAGGFALAPSWINMGTPIALCARKTSWWLAHLQTTSLSCQQFSRFIFVGGNESITAYKKCFRVFTYVQITMYI